VTESTEAPNIYRFVYSISARTKRLKGFWSSQFQ